MTEQNGVPAKCSDQGGCLEMKTGDGDVTFIIQSKDSQGPQLPFPRTAIAVFLNGVKQGEFDDLA